MSGTLAEGTALNGPEELVRALVEERYADLVRQTFTNTLAYGLDRPLEYFDGPALRQMIEAFKANGFRFQALLRQVVTS